MSTQLKNDHDLDKMNQENIESEHKQTLIHLENFKKAFDIASIVAITNDKGIITYANDTFCNISGYAKDELIGQTHRIVNSGFHSKSFFKDMWETIRRGNVWKGEIKNRAKDGSTYWVNTTIIPFLNEMV